jgi:hypothetical protein
MSTGVNEKARKNKGFMVEGNLRQHLNGLEGCPEWTFNQGVMGSNPIGLTTFVSLDNNFSGLDA